MTTTVFLLSTTLLVTFGLVAQAADYLEKTDFQKSRAFSPAVVTDGGRIVWMAGQTATAAADGEDIAGCTWGQAARAGRSRVPVTPGGGAGTFGNGRLLFPSL